MDLLENEEIKPIEGYERYLITSFGRVWSTFSNKWLKPAINTRGNYKREYVSLGQKNKKYIHRLVAAAFIPNPNNFTEVDHIDANPLNNKVSNLRWANRQINMANPLTLEKVSKNTGSFLEILDTKTNKVYIGRKATAEDCGVCVGTIQAHLLKKVLNPRWVKTGRAYNPITNTWTLR